MPDLISGVETAMREVCASVVDAVRRYAHVSGMGLGDDLTEWFIPSFVFSQLGDQYAMTLETNATKLLARNAEVRGRSDVLAPTRERSLAADIRNLDSTERVDLVIYYDDGSERRHRPFLTLVEFKLWNGWPADRAKLLRIMEAIDACPFGAMCFIAEGARDHDWLASYGEAARRERDIRIIERAPEPMHNGLPLYVGAQVVARPMPTGDRVS